MTERHRGFPMNALRVCVDEETACVEGRAYSKMEERPLFFSNYAQLLLLADKMFDRHGYPQHFQERRSFCREEEKSSIMHMLPEQKLSDETVLGQRGRRRTFDLVIKSRRRSGWQGCLLTDEEQADFESEIELLRMLEKIS
ncbi:MAG: hypothetical protein Q4B57_08680 [Eubacteriales bacterium]|nr:hypothetical protein [Eubacteriales bacterium]